MTQQHQLPELALGAVELGQDLGSVEHQFTPEDVARYAESLQDPSGWYRARRADGAVRVHPMMLATDVFRLLRGHFMTPWMIWAEEQHSYLGPIWTGQRLRTVGKVVGKGVKRGREYVEVETTTLGEEGNELARRRTLFFITVQRRVTR